MRWINLRQISARVLGVIDATILLIGEKFLDLALATVYGIPFLNRSAAICSTVVRRLRTERARQGVVHLSFHCRCF